MSKLAVLKRASYGDPAIFGALAGFLPKIIKGAGKLLGIGKKAVAAIPATAKVVGGAALSGAAMGAATSLLAGGGGGRGASGSWARRRGRGITATELRGYRKVANLIHKEGMVSRRSRGRKHD